MTSSPPADGRDRLRCGLPQLGDVIRLRRVRPNLRHRPAGGAQLLHVAMLVREAALADQLQLRIVALRLVHKAGQRRATQLCEVPAPEEPHQVRGGVDGPAIDQLHAGDRSSAREEAREASVITAPA